MKMSKLLTVLALVMVFVLTFASCEFFTPSTGNETTPPAAGQTTPPATEETTPGEITTLAINVVPQALEIHAGDEIDLMFGVTVNVEANLIIEDDDGFDADVEGTYTITYMAVTETGATATATRTVTVLKALSALTLEVRANRLGENKWQGNSDLATHRIIKATLLGEEVGDKYRGYARRAALAATEGELRALSAERKIEALYKTLYLSRHIGEEFSTTVSSIILGNTVTFIINIILTIFGSMCIIVFKDTMFDV